MTSNRPDCVSLLTSTERAKPMKAKFMDNGPALSVCGVTKKHAKRAIKWMKDRSLLAFYNQQDKSLCAFEFKHGREWTYKAMRDALEATR